MLELTLVRHASTELNESNRYQGRLDPPLSPRGRREAELLGDELRGQHFDLLIHSGMRRTAETATIALPGSSFTIDPRLGEFDFGEWDGLTYDECAAADARLAEWWITDPTRYSPPGGESYAAFADRVDRALGELELRGSALLITHGGPIRRILASALGLEWHHVVLFQLSPGGITRLALHPEGGHLRSMNETMHLKSRG